jgi:hypothetical protein
VELDEAESFYAQISLLDGGSQCLQEKLDQTKANMTALELGLRKAVKEVNAYKIRLQNSFKNRTLNLHECERIKENIGKKILQYLSEKLVQFVTFAAHLLQANIWHNLTQLS